MGLGDIARKLVVDAKANPLVAAATVLPVAAGLAPLAIESADVKAQKKMMQQQSGQVPPQPGADQLSKGAAAPKGMSDLIKPGAPETDPAITSKGSATTQPMELPKTGAFYDKAKNLAEVVTLFGTPVVIGADLYSRGKDMAKRASILPSLLAVKQVPNEVLDQLGENVQRELLPDPRSPFPKPTPRTTI